MRGEKEDGHGACRFTRKPTGDILAIQRIKEFHVHVPNTHLMMHSSSSLPQEWLETIRKRMAEKPSEPDPCKYLASMS
jgi:fructose-bisphosphate aldolase class II